MMRRRVGRVGRPGLIGTMARTAVVAGTASAVAGGVSRRQQARLEQAADAEAFRQQQAMAMQPGQAAGQPAPVQPPAPAPVDLVTQLKELASLVDKGILTEEEFAAQKARLLAT
jgi:hypothetical protein